MIAGIGGVKHVRPRSRAPELVGVGFIAGYGLGLGAVEIRGGKSYQYEDREGAYQGMDSLGKGRGI